MLYHVGNIAIIVVKTKTEKPMTVTLLLSTATATIAKITNIVANSSIQHHPVPNHAKTSHNYYPNERPLYKT